MSFDRALLTAELARDEGVRLKPYRDTVGKLTIGIGRNLDDKGLSRAEVEHLFANDVASVEADLDRALPWWRSLSDARQRVLLNMCFNMGIGIRGKRGLLSFSNTLRAVQEGRYDDAATGMLASKWARQVGKRATRLAAMMRNGG